MAGSTVVHDLPSAPQHPPVLDLVTPTWTPTAGRPADRSSSRRVDAADRSVATVSICIPARNEASSIGPLVRDMQRLLVDRDMVSEIVVVDDRSEDITSLLARAAGARVVAGHDVLPSFGPGLGKGDAMWRSLVASSGDIIVWCDADLRHFDVTGLTRLVQPLIDDQRIRLAKGYFTRLAADGTVGEGGRVTELVVRPLLSLLFPDATHIREPLGGIYAMRRDAAEQLPFEPDYGVDIGLLLDTLHRWGRSSITQVDLGNLAHRNQSIDGLAVQAAAVQRAILSRAQAQLARIGSRPRLAGPAVPVRPPISELSLRELGLLELVSRT